MDIANSQLWTFLQVQRGLDRNRVALFRAQEQLASGKRILRPSDDAVGSAKALSLRRQLEGVGRLQGAVDAARPRLQAAAGALERSSSVLAEVRSIVLQGLNGTSNADDRATLAASVEELRDELLELANTRSNESYVFGGSSGRAAPFVEQEVGGRRVVVYRGDDASPRVAVGVATDVALGLPGADVFQRFAPLGVAIEGLSGAAPGASASQGTGFSELELRHDATSGALGAGLALVSGGAQDTFLGDRALVVDATAGTVRFGAGPARALPGPSASDLADFVVRDEHGAELHLDFTGFTGTDLSTTLNGAGSVRFGGGAFVPLDTAQADQRLIDPTTGDVLQVDLRGVTRASTDLVVFQGASDVFALLDGIAADLRNEDGLSTEEVLGRLQARLPELDRSREDVLGGLGVLGARLERLDEAGTRLADVDLHLTDLLSGVEDADVATVALQLARSEQTLQIAQSTGVRLLQNTLLNYLR